GKEIALITRNAYGAQVLNAANAMFIDIDFPDSANTTPRRGLFRKPSPVVSHEEAAVQKVRLWAAGRPDLGIRVYRTFGGLRCLVTSHLFHPADRDALAILQALESDPLYIRLCQAQACFRARLTAKPWRMGIKPPPFGCVYPWETPSAETTFRGWEKTYQQSSQQYAACHYLVHLGPGSVHPEIEPILKWHDNTACSRQNLPLA
ncbi:MAG TPA: hypothetical protein PLD47_16160, partial [Aggregatilineales bacterium]|nr:hypothetical protein [Aggregatilineales bacterium]